MLSLLSAVLLLAFGAPRDALAGSPIRTGGNLGLGVGGGTWVDGLSIKYFMSGKTALQGVIGAWGYGHNYYDGYGYYGYYGYNRGVVGLSGDFLWEQPAIADSEGLELAWNAGLGPSIQGGDGLFGLGVHGTLGLEFNFKPIPIDLVLEYKPGLIVLPGFGADLYDFAVHLRIYPF